MFEKIDEISLTIDLWSKPSKEIFYRNHLLLYLWLADGTVVLLYNWINGRHTAENVFQPYEDTYFKIAQKVKHIVTDNASNMRKAFALPGYKDGDDDSDEEIDNDEEDDNDMNDMNEIELLDDSSVGDLLHRKKLMHEPKKKRKIFAFIDEQQKKSLANNIQNEKEVEEYLKEPCIEQKDDPYPNLDILAKQVLSVPASSAPVERLFSIAGKVFKPDHCQMKDRHISKFITITWKLFLLLLLLHGQIEPM